MSIDIYLMTSVFRWWLNKKWAYLYRLFNGIALNFGIAWICWWIEIENGIGKGEASLKMQQYNRAQNNLLSALANSSTLMCECTEHMSVYLLAFKMKNVIWLHVKWVKYWKTLRLLNAQIQAMCVQRETKKDERRRRRIKKIHEEDVKP